MHPEAARLIDRLGLVRHPEGGYFRETYRSTVVIPRESLPPRYGAPRVAMTSIYFLLAGNDFSAFHRLASDEIWHFYSGGGLLLYVLDEGGLAIHHLGTRWDAGEVPQAVVRASSWMGARLADSDSYALVGCTVAPGFEFEDFELAPRDELLVRYPQHRSLILSLTRSTEAG